VEAVHATTAKPHRRRPAPGDFGRTAATSVRPAASAISRAQAVGGDRQSDLAEEALLESLLELEALGYELDNAAGIARLSLLMPRALEALQRGGLEGAGWPVAFCGAPLDRRQSCTLEAGGHSFAGPARSLDAWRISMTCASVTQLDADAELLEDGPGLIVLFGSCLNPGPQRQAPAASTQSFSARDGPGPLAGKAGSGGPGADGAGILALPANPLTHRRRCAG